MANHAYATQRAVYALIAMLGPDGCLALISLLDGHANEELNRLGVALRGACQ